MSVTVYVWPRHLGNVGHASIQIGAVYASYWPSSPAGKKDFKVGATHAASYPREYRTDVRLERQDALHAIRLDGLDEAAMLTAWDELRQVGSRYNMVKHNCSTVVATLLLLGSGVKPPCAPAVRIDGIGLPFHLRLSMHVRFLGNTIRMWSPEAVADYARQIQLHLGARRP